ncbi:helix-turn-helix transcriptional regulator [Micromonospora sp. NPDC048930]|uniref:helix-turn-helix transcriptional regulator n=1 Tax=Micromonospora sp. NPDC048930 TaxID=3364261 RepID=UPI00370FF823
MGEVPGPLVGPAEIMDMLRVSRSRFRQIVMHPNFPRPFQTLQAGSVWLRSDVERYIAEYRRPRHAVDDEE